MYLLRYIHTIRYLTFKQIVYRLYYRCYPLSFKSIKTPALRQWQHVWQSPMIKPNVLDETGIIRILNEQPASLQDTTLWNAKHHSKLWHYHVSYFDALNQFGSEHLISQCQAYITQWLCHHPSHTRRDLDSYPMSLRIVNWIKWFSRHAHLMDSCILDSLANQVDLLSQRIEYHLMGNHVFANAKALVFAGSFFKGSHAERWLRQGIKILDKEIQKQFLADGAHVELSPMYHAILMWDMCDLVNLAHSVDIELFNSRQLQWACMIERGLQWLQHMTHPDGKPSFFNDTTFDQAPGLEDLIQYAEQLGIHHVSSNSRMHWLQHSGYCVINCDSQSKAILDLAEVGPSYQPGHAHADTLSFELSLFGQRFIVNSGISTYEKNELRQFQRSTAAHNTVCINHQNSSEVWGGFRVGKRAHPKHIKIRTESECVMVQATHQGYRTFLMRGHEHHRQWRFHPQELIIRDEIVGVTACDATAYFYFHPDVVITSHHAHNLFVLELPEQKKVVIKMMGALEINVIKSSWYPGFGRSLDNIGLQIRLKGRELITHITW